jgi:hypothetical protein
LIALGFPDFGPVSLRRSILDGLLRPARVRPPYSGALPLSPRLLVDAGLSPADAERHLAGSVDGPVGYTVGTAPSGPVLRRTRPVRHGTTLPV